MAINIKDPETDALARRLATLTGEKITDAVRLAVEERLRREERRNGKASLQALLTIVDEFSALPVIDPRTPDEILGYDKDGLPT